MCCHNTSTSRGGACVVFLVAPEGELRGSRGRGGASRSTASTTSGSTASRGHTFGPFRRGADRAGAVLATGSSREDALDRARRAAGAIRFLVG